MNDSPSDEKVVRRRTVLEICFWWAVWNVLDEAKALAGTVCRELLSDENSPKFIHNDLAFGLFLSSLSRTEFIPPSNWTHKPPDVILPNGTKTYGHEFEVLRSITGFFAQAPITWDVKKESWPAHATASQVMLASGSSNLATQDVIGTPERPNFSPKIGESRIALPYAIGMGTGKLKRLQYGEHIERSRLAICTSEEKIVAQAEGRHGHQVDDYLLVTRVPGTRPDIVLTVLAGLHGPGTRSAEMLFSTIRQRDLDELASWIDYKPEHIPYFQAVFRASRFTKVNGSDVPAHLELVTEGCPPRRLTVR